MTKIFERAKWIWCSQAADKNAYVVFRKTFSVRGARACSLRISADAQYRVSLNGQFVLSGQYPDFPKYKVYDECDITESLREGDNELEIGVYCPITNTSVYRLGVPGLLYEILADGELIDFSDERVLCAPDANYRSGDIEMVTVQLGYTFDYDARRETQGFAPAIAVDGPAQLHPRPIHRLDVLSRKQGLLQAQGVYRDAEAATIGGRMQYAPIAFRALRDMTGLAERPCFPSQDGVSFHAEGGDGLYLLIDLQEEDAGWLDLELELDGECEVLIGWGEHTDDLRLRTFVGTRNFASRYMAKKGLQRFTHYYQRSGLRYVQLFIAAKAVRLYYAGILPTAYPLCDRPAFNTADRLHSRIYEVCRRTLAQCMHEHYEDCPWREQALYAMDSRNQMLCGYYAFGEYNMPKASLRLLGMSLREDGMLELCAPAKIPITIPSFSAMYLVQLQEYHLFSGDAEFAREMLPVARKIADSFIARIANGGLIPVYTDKQYWNFYEWQPYLEGYRKAEQDDEPLRFDAPLNCLVALGLTRLAGMMDALGEPGVADYSRAATGLQKAIHTMFWNEEMGAYASFHNSRGMWHYAELTQALAVCSGACPEACANRVLTRLTDRSLVPVTSSYSIFQFDALMTRPETYSRWMFDHVAEDWGYMLYHGATTFWETLVGAWDFDNAGSLCHGWSAVPLYLYFAYALGLTPTKPGFAEYAVKPVTSGLYELSGKVLLRDGQEIALPPKS